jgi:RNA polymerase sigma factor (TIGR02999 family)
MSDDRERTAIEDLIRAAERGAPGSNGELFTELYRELHRLAASQLRRNPGSSLGATTLLHELYIGISARRPDFPDRARFFAYAARAMRGLVIDYARERHAQKRGGEYHLTALDTEVADHVANVGDMDRLHAALIELERADASLAELVDLKFFCGFTFAEIAAQRGVSERTVQRDWHKARLLLRHVLVED